MGIRRSRKLLGALMVAGVLASGSYALTASNTFASATNQAGAESQTISGYEVSNVHYTLDSLDVTKYSAVSFDLDGVASDVRAKVSAAASTYSTCSNTGDNSWSCPISDTVQDSDELTVIAVQ